MSLSNAPPAFQYSRSIPGAEKVAVLLLALEREIARQLLNKLDSNDIDLIRTASEHLEPITASDLTGMVEEFANRFGECLDFLGSPTEMQQLLTTALDSDGQDNNSPAAIDDAVDAPPVWPTVVELDEDKIVTFLESEHPQTAAFMLAKTGPQFAAVIMGQLPDDLRDSLVRRLLNMRPVGSLPTAVLESSVAHSLLGDDGSENINKARSQLANIINLMDNDEKTAVLDSLLRDKPAEAEDVKRRLFSFEDIEGLPDKSRLTLFDQVSSDNVVTALRGANDVLTELVLSSLSSRTRRMVESELKRPDETDEKVIADARRGIAAVALQLAERGDIVLRIPDAE